jgi:hypothetical protein
MGMDITGETFTSEIRSEPDQGAALIATFTVTVTDAAEGIITLVLDDSVTDDITVDSGFMDIKRVSGGEPLPTFDRPLEVEFRGTVTA